MRWKSISISQGHTSFKKHVTFCLISFALLWVNPKCSESSIKISTITQFWKFGLLGFFICQRQTSINWFLSGFIVFISQPRLQYSFSSDILRFSVKLFLAFGVDCSQNSMSSIFNMPVSQFRWLWKIKELQTDTENVSQYFIDYFQFHLVEIKLRL